MNKENRRGSSIVKLVLLFPLVMAAIGLCAAPDSGTLIVDGEVVHYGDWDPVKQQYKWPLTHRYTCGAVGTYSYTSEAKVGVFRLEFTEDTTIQGECYTRTAPATGESYALCTSSSSLEVYLNGHTVHVLPSGATTDETRASWQSKIYSGESLKIYGGASSSTGVGTLDVHHGYIHSYNDLGIYGAIVNISEGDDKAEVTAIRSGVTGSLTVADSHISISGYSKLISAQDGFTCTGSMLDLVSRKSSHGDSVSDTAVIEDGNYQVGGYGISFSGSVVSIVSEHPGMSGIRPRGKLLVEDSCVAIVSDRSCIRLDGYSGGGQKDFRNARISAVSKTGNVLEGGDTDSEKSVATFGSGEYVFGSSGNKQGGNLMDDPEYYLNPEGKIAALVSGRIAIDGGNLEICAPNAYGCDTHEFTMKDGSLKMVDTIDHSKTVHAILDETAVKETVSANAQFAGWTAAHSQMLKNMLAHQDAAGVGAFAGRAGGVIETERFFQSGGRIDPGTALYGGYIASYNAGWNWAAPVFTGGSLKMDFRYFYYQSGVKEYRAMTPINDLGQKLMRVDYEPYWVSIPPLSGEGSLGFPTMAQLSGGPYSAWCKPLVLRSASPYDVEYVPVLTFEKGASPYVQWLIANFGSSPTACPSMLFEILSLDGKTLYWDWKSCSELGPGLAASINYKWDCFKELAEGCYILRMTLDPNGQVQDSYRGDNVATYMFTVTSPGSAVHAVTYKPGLYGVGLEQTAMKQNGMALTLGGATFTRRGYKQTGWSLTDGGAKVYDLNGTYATDAEMVLYPCWTANLVEPAQTFAEALGVPGLECSPYGSTGEWQLRIDPDWTCDGNGSAMVGNKVMDETFSPGFSFKVTGPTQMKFSYSNSPSATFYVESGTAGTLYRDNNSDNTPGEKTDWKQVVLDIPAGEQTISFRVLLVFRNEYNFTGFWIDNLQLGDFGREPEPTVNCTVTFDANGGNVSEKTRTVLSGAAIGLLPTPTRAGYEFLGWFTTANGGRKVYSTSKTSTDVVYYAHWSVVAVGGYPNLDYVSLNKSQLGIDDTLSMSYEVINPSSSAATEEDNLDVYIDGQLTVGTCIKKLNGSGRVFSTIHVRSTTMGVGTHAVVVKLRNGTGAFSYSVTVVDNNTANPKMDWAFHKLKASEPDSFYLGSSLKDMTGRTSFTVGQSIYVEVHFWNAKQVRNLDPVYVQLDLSTGSSMQVQWNSMDPGVTGYLTDSVRMPAMLQNLPVGSYTLTATIDPYNNWWETDENNNVKRINFSVVAASTPSVPPRAATSRYLYDESKVSVAADKGDVAPYETAAAVYDGRIVDDNGALKGTIQVKVAKGKVDRKTGELSAKVTATVQLADGSKKITFKGGVADEAGNVTGLTAAGHSLDITLGVDGMGGTLDGMAIDGARNLFSAKDADSKAVAAAIEANWLGAVNIVTENAVLTVTIAKKGKVKVSGTVNGVKVSASSQLLIGEKSCCIPVVVTKKASLAFNVWLGESDGAASVEVVGLAGVKAADTAGTLKAGAKFSLGAAADTLAAKLPGLYRAYLPEGLSVAASGKKWIVADGAKAGKVTFAKGTTVIDETKLGANPAGLKLTYKSKDGSFKGSFKVFALVGGKIKAYTANVTGVMVGTTGYGTATVKGGGSVPVTIE